MRTLKALVFQQDEIARSRIVGQLEDFGSFEIKTFDRGRDARGVYHQFAPDMIIVDSSIDDLGTIELVQRCKSNSPHTRIVLTTETLETELAENPLRRLADAVLWRPFNVWELRQVVADQVSALSRTEAAA